MDLGGDFSNNSTQMFGLFGSNYTQDNHFFKLRIQCLVNGLWEFLPLTHSKPVTNTAQTCFNISKDFCLEKQPPEQLSIGVGLFGEAVDWIKRYRLVYYESYGSPPQDRPINISPSYITIPAGVSWDKYPQFDFSTEFERKFLTWQERPKCITKEQPEWLYFFNENIVNGSLIISVRKDDNTNDSFTLPVLLEANKLYYVNSGYTQLNLEALFPTLPSVNIVQYSIQFLDGTTPLTEKFTYTICCECNPWDRYFLFCNGIGGFDTIRAKGKEKATIKINRKEAARYKAMDYAVLDGQYNLYGNSMYNTFEGSLGYSNKEKIDYLESLLLSNKVYAIDIENNKFIPIIVETNNIEKYQDDDDLFFIRWSYRYAWDNCAWSPC